jgi:large subunit ribosomal protein L15
MFRVIYQPLAVGRIAAAFEGQAEISLEDLYAKGLVRRGSLVKVLADGELKAAITVEAHRFSKSAAEKIAAAGGTAKALEG